MSDPLPDPASVRAAAAAAKKLSQALEALAAALDPASPNRLAAATAALDGLSVPDPAPLRAAAEAWLAEEKAGRRERLREGLRALCEREGLELQVVTRDPLELRLAPIALVVDLEHNKVQLSFGRESLGTCEVDADVIARARAAAVAELEGGEWDAAAHHRLLRLAWGRAAASPGDWAELADVYAELVWLRQPRSVRLDPAGRKLEAYGRARFVYDLWRLRRDRALSADGWRLTVAPATGGSTKDKTRVFWLEDDRGQGQYHLTLRFVRDSEAPHGG